MDTERIAENLSLKRLAISTQITECEALPDQWDAKEHADAMREAYAQLYASRGCRHLPWTLT